MKSLVEFLTESQINYDNVRYNDDIIDTYRRKSREPVHLTYYNSSDKGANLYTFAVVAGTKFSDAEKITAVKKLADEIKRKLRGASNFRYEYEKESPEENIKNNSHFKEHGNKFARVYLKVTFTQS